jgi:carotenoid cleavage dioxygenase
MERATRGEFPIAWEPERGARIGVMPRRGGNLRWFDVDTCYVFHPMNAYDDGDSVVVDVARYERMEFLHPRASRDPGWTGANQARMHRFRVNLGAGSVSSTPLDDVSVEFPRMDERRLGSPYRFGYVAAAGPEGRAERRPIWTAIRRYDFAKNAFETRLLGEGNGASEPLFVPRHAGAAEDDGYVIFFAYDRARDASDFWILDAANIAGEAVARVRLPHRVPYGFHGNWVPAG